jgi:hypothetical protein
LDFDAPAIHFPSMGGILKLGLMYKSRQKIGRLMDLVLPRWISRSCQLFRVFFKSRLPLFSFPTPRLLSLVMIWKHSFSPDVSSHPEGRSTHLPLWVQSCAIWHPPSLVSVSCTNCFYLNHLKKPISFFFILALTEMLQSRGRKAYPTPNTQKKEKRKKKNSVFRNASVFLNATFFALFLFILILFPFSSFFFRITALFSPPFYP